MTDLNKLIEQIDIRVQEALLLMADVDQMSGTYVRCMDDLERLTKVRAGYIDQMYVVQTMIGQIAERTPVEPAKKLVWKHTGFEPRYDPMSALDQLFACPEGEYDNVEHIVCNRTTKLERQYIAVECAYHVTILMGVDRFPKNWISYIYTTNCRADALKPFSFPFSNSYWLENTLQERSVMEVVKGFNKFTLTGNLSVFINSLNAWSDISGEFQMKHLRECAIVALSTKLGHDDMLCVPR